MRAHNNAGRQGGGGKRRENKNRRNSLINHIVGLNGLHYLLYLVAKSSQATHNIVTKTRVPPWKASWRRWWLHLSWLHCCIHCLPSSWMRAIMREESKFVISSTHLHTHSHPLLAPLIHSLLASPFVNFRATCIANRPWKLYSFLTAVRETTCLKRGHLVPLLAV